MVALDSEGRQGQQAQGPLCHRCFVYRSCRPVWSADPAAGDEVLDCSRLLDVRFCWRYKCHLLATHRCLHWPPCIPFKKTIWNPNICTVFCACITLNWMPKAQRRSTPSSPSICNLKILVQNCGAQKYSAAKSSPLMAFVHFHWPNLWQNDEFGQRAELMAAIRGDFASQSWFSQPDAIYLVSPC